jgi:hypothetical protein
MGGATVCGEHANPSTQDGCNRSGLGICRVNVFVGSGHFDIRHRDMDLHGVSKSAVLCINLSCAGSKPQPVKRWAEAVVPRPHARGHWPCHLDKSRLRLERSREGARRPGEAGAPWQIGRSRNSESQRARFQENSVAICQNTQIESMRKDQRVDGSSAPSVSHERASGASCASPRA